MLNKMDPYKIFRLIVLINLIFFLLLHLYYESYHSVQYKTNEQIKFKKMDCEPKSKELCQLNITSNLVGRFNISTKILSNEEIEINIKRLKKSQFGINCIRHQSVAIIVPYRNRSEHLQIFLNNIHQMLIRQHLAFYHIFVIEQHGDDPFNRGRLMNIGFIEALKWYHGFDCFIFHDVDLIPEDDRNEYLCSKQRPRHMSGYIDKFDYEPYTDYSTGGVCALTRSQFELINGYSNNFWGWGGEDDDLTERIVFFKMKILRMENVFQRYTMLKHEQEKPNPIGSRLIHMNKKTYCYKGLNSLRYKMIERLDVGHLYTKIVIDPCYSKHQQLVV